MTSHTRRFRRQDVQHLPHLWIPLKKDPVSPDIKVLDALKRPARVWSILVDRAAIVLAEKLTPAVGVRQRVFDNHTFAVANRNSRRIRRELPHLVPPQQGVVIVPVLLAARRRTEVAGAFAEDGDADGSHVEPMLCDSGRE